MKNIIQIFALSLIVSCGTDNSSSGGNEEKTIYTKEEVQNAMMIANEDERPECKVKSHLIYVISKKEFQSCDGKGKWEKVEITNTINNNTTQNTTVSNSTYEAVNVFTDQNGKDWIMIFMVQKSNISSGKVCPKGYAVATKDQVNSVSTTTTFYYSKQAAHHTRIYIWSSDTTEIATYATASGGMYTSLTWISNPAGISGYVPDAYNVICTK